MGVPIETVSVDSRSAQEIASAQNLQGGSLYRFVAGGTWTYATGFGADLADAECSADPNRPVPPWERYRWGAGAPVPDAGDIFVNNREVEWVPAQSDALGCNPTDHTYFLDFRAASTAKVTFIVAESSRDDNQGILSVDIYRVVPPEPHPPPPPPPTPPDASVDTANPLGATTAYSLNAGQTYRIVASGTWRYGVHWGALADAVCAVYPGDYPAPLDQNSFPGKGIWVRDRFPNGLTQLFADGRAVEWVPEGPGAPGCDQATHRYEAFLTPDVTRPVNFRVVDTDYGDNNGVLEVRISPVGPPGVPLPVGQHVETVAIDSREALGATTVASLQQGATYLLVARGTYFYEGYPFWHQADAECSWFNLGAGLGITTGLAVTVQALPERNRFASAGGDPLDVYVNGGPVEWEPGAPCQEGTHTYWIRYSPPSTGTVNLRVQDATYGDNAGWLYVHVFLTSAPV